MDIPEAKASTSGHFCVAARSSEFMGYPSSEKVRMWTICFSIVPDIVALIASLE